MGKFFVYFFLVLFSVNTFSQREKIDPISFGGVKLAEDRMPINLDDFHIQKSGNKIVRAKLIKNTLQWVRLDQVLLVPRALLEISFSGQDRSYSITYAGKKIIPVYDKKLNVFTVQLFISLFEALPVSLFEDDKKLSILRIIPKIKERKKTRLIDYSCAPYELEIFGLEEDLISIGCRVQKVGEFGNEKPFLEVIFTTASHRLPDDSDPPYLINFDKSGESSMSLVNFDGKKSDLRIKARLSKKIPRLKIAAGFGPYVLNSKRKNGERKNQVAPTAMLYGNFSLNEKSSFRFFDSYTRNETIFHNWGTYFAWELAEFCDKRCLLTSLIGIQGVDYRYDARSKNNSEMIFPQGFEFVYLHPFNKLNYKLAYGMFASFSGLYDYQNIWIRFGKETFWEINFIEWKRDERSASMIGLSFGFPVMSFF